MSTELSPVESSHKISFEKPKSSHLTLKVFLCWFQQRGFGFHSADKEKTQATKLFYFAFTLKYLQHRNCNFMINIDIKR